VERFNEERPHEALKQATPSESYQPSPRPFPSQEPELDYPLHDDVLRVSSTGHIHVGRGRGKQFYLTAALASQNVGISELDDGRWLVTFATLDLGHVDLAAHRFDPLAEASSAR
jgi:hypothetical protein